MAVTKIVGGARIYTIETCCWKVGCHEKRRGVCKSLDIHHVAAASPAPVKPLAFPRVAVTKIVGLHVATTLMDCWVAQVRADAQEGTKEKDPLGQLKSFIF